jgi:hypothetical protein
MRLAENRWDSGLFWVIANWSSFVAIMDKGGNSASHGSFFTFICIFFR